MRRTDVSEPHKTLLSHGWIAGGLLAKASDSPGCLTIVMTFLGRGRFLCVICYIALWLILRAGAG